MGGPNNPVLQKSLLFILLILLPSFMLAQIPTRPNAYNQDSLKTGEWIEYYNAKRQAINPTDDSIAYYITTSWDKGEQVGEVKEYYGTTNKLKRVSTYYPHSRYHGPITQYSEDGHIYRYIYFENGGVNSVLTLKKIEEILIEQSKTIPKSHEHATLTYYLGFFNFLNGDLAKAEVAFKKSFALTENIFGRDAIEFQGSRLHFGNLYISMGRYQAALDILTDNELWFRTELEKDPENRNLLSSQVLLLYVISNAHLNLKHYESAISNAQQSLAIGKKLYGKFDPHVDVKCQTIAKAYRNTGNYDKAIALLEKTKGNREIPETFQRQGKTSPRDTVTTDLLLAELYKIQGINHKQIERIYLEGLASLKLQPTFHQKEISQLKQQMAIYYYHTGKKKEAQETFKELVKYHDDQIDYYFDNLGEEERDDFYNTQKKTFEIIKDIAIRDRTNNPEGIGEIFNYQINYKGLLLNTSSKIKERIIESGDRKLIDLYDEVQTLKQQVGELKSKPSIKRELDSLQSLLAVKDKDLTQLSTIYKGSSEKIKWQNLRDRLEKNEALIEMIRVPVFDFQLSKWTDSTRYAALIITNKTKENPIVQIFPSGNFLEGKALNAYQKAIQFQVDDNESYDNYWAPLNESLKGIEKVYFSPDGVFHQINLETLYNTKKDRYLSDERNIELITSSSDFAKTFREPLNSKYALLLGNPDFGDKVVTEAEANDENDVPAVFTVERGAALVALPGTKKEVQSIEKILTDNQWRTKTLLDSEATEEQLKDMIKPNVLHIATHGYFQSDVEGEITYSANPMFRSGLLLSSSEQALKNENSFRGVMDGKRENGILTAHEAMNLNVDNTNLVVLSACETGLGEIRNGEGIYGLQRAFISAGARSIIMSLWKVSDQTTQELMTKFYANWFAGQSKREALSNAKQRTQEKPSAPLLLGSIYLDWGIKFKAF